VGVGLRLLALGRVDEEGKRKGTTNGKTQSGRLERLWRRNRRLRCRTLEEDIDSRSLLEVWARSTGTREMAVGNDAVMLQEIVDPRETNKEVHLRNLEENGNTSAQ
jgi:hypothetical protein